MECYTIWAVYAETQCAEIVKYEKVNNFFYMTDI